MLPSDLDAAQNALFMAWQQSPFPSLKITNYFHAYAELFSHLRGINCTFIETGVLDGGSLFMWRSWLGPKARIIGIDLNPEAAKWRAYGFEILIGDQGDPTFWQAAFAQIGEFDALLDDGGHQSFQQIVTLNEAIKASKRRATIVVEDTVTSFMKDFASHGNHCFLNYAKAATDMLIAKVAAMYPGRLVDMPNQEGVNAFRTVQSIRFYSGIVGFMIEPSATTLPKVLRNKQGQGSKDFRYEGKTSALIDWPNPFVPETVKVEGGK